MADLGSHAPRQRLGVRRPVGEPAEIVILQTKRFGRRIEVAHAVLVRDVSVSGALLVVGSDLRPGIGQVFELSMGGQRSPVRVRWVRNEPESGGYASGPLFGVEFIDPHPDFLPAIYRWLRREAALGTSRVR
jgi:hypothetical protein